MSLVTLRKYGAGVRFGRYAAIARLQKPEADIYPQFLELKSLPFYLRFYPVCQGSLRTIHRKSTR